VVLPTLTTCTTSPSTPGCSVVLPTLAQCVGSPTLQGCLAVLPSLSVCVSNPATPGCAVVAAPVSDAAVVGINEAIKVTIDVLAKSTDSVVVGPAAKEDEKKDDSTPAVVASVQGEKPNEVAKKTYCN
jgi:hypothetical protein